MKSKIVAKGSCLPLRSARRSATVTISAPLASSASRIFSGEENFPVPRIRREPNSCPAMVNGRFTKGIAREHRSSRAGCRECRSRPGNRGRILTLPPWQGCSPSPREGRAGRGTGRGAVRRELLIIGFPLSLTLSPLLRRGEREIFPAHLWWQYQGAVRLPGCVFFALV